MVTKDSPDVFGEVAEEVTRIPVFRDPPAGQGGTKAVDTATAVRVNQASNQGAGMDARELALPGLQLDRARMLVPSPVLWECKGKSRMAELDGGHAPARTAVPRCAPLRKNGAERRGHLVHDGQVRSIEGDNERCCPRRLHREISVAEIDSEQVAVGPGVGRSPACMSGLHTQEVGSAASVPPRVDRSPADAGQLGDLPFRNSGLQQLADQAELTATVAIHANVRLQRPRTESALRSLAGGSSSIGRVPVSKTGGSRFESWLPRRSDFPISTTSPELSWAPQHSGRGAAW